MQPDDQWADLALRTPGGFAGVLYGRDGGSLLMLTKPEDEVAAKAALAPEFTGFPIRDAVVLRARWDFAQLVDWYRYLTTRTPIWSLGINSGDKSEADNRILFGVTDSLSLRAVAHVLDSIEIPCDLVLLQIRAPAVQLAPERIP